LSGREGIEIEPAVEGAVIIREYEDAYTTLITYKQRCDGCGYLPARLPISVSMLPNGAVAYGTHHAESFDCPVCEKRQVVKLRGSTGAAIVRNGQDNVDVKPILLVESYPDDELMTLRVFSKANIKNEVVVARDGDEALYYLEGAYAERNATPQIILIEPKLPKVDGLEVLECLRADGRTRRLPVAVFVSSEEEQDSIEGHGPGGNVYVRKPLDFARFCRAVRQLGLMVFDG
jgi:two-component system, response regulator